MCVRLIGTVWGQIFVLFYMVSSVWYSRNKILPILHLKIYCRQLFSPNGPREIIEIILSQRKSTIPWKQSWKNCAVKVNKIHESQEEFFVKFGLGNSDQEDKCYIVNKTISQIWIDINLCLCGVPGVARVTNHYKHCLNTAFSILTKRKGYVVCNNC